jgi:hypothetical protein
MRPKHLATCIRKKNQRNLVNFPSPTVVQGQIRIGTLYRLLVPSEQDVKIIICIDGRNPRVPGSIPGHYKKVVGLERGPLSLVSTTEELLDRKVAAPVYKTENTAIGIRHADHVAPSIRKSWQSLHRQAAVARSV